CEDQDLLLRSSSIPRFPLAGGMIKAQDQDLLLRSFQAARFANVPEVLLGYRESRLDIRKNLNSRYYLASSFWQNHCQDRHYWLALCAVLGQVFKGLVDIIAIGSGLDYHILRHRARPVTPGEKRRWEAVWAGLNDAGTPPRTRPRTRTRGVAH